MTEEPHGPVRVDADNVNNASVWRIVWDDGAFTFKTEWSIHYDSLWNLYNDYNEAMPGADVKMQVADVETVSNIRTMEFGEPQ